MRVPRSLGLLGAEPRVPKTGGFPRRQRSRRHPGTKPMRPQAPAVFRQTNPRNRKLCSQPAACRLLSPARTILALDAHVHAICPHLQAPEGPCPFWENPLHPSAPGVTFPLILYPRREADTPNSPRSELHTINLLTCQPSQLLWDAGKQVSPQTNTCSLDMEMHGGRALRFSCRSNFGAIVTHPESKR